MDKTTIELKYPIKIDGTEVRSLQIRRPKVRDQLVNAKLGKTDEEKEVRLLANLCEVAPENIEDLDLGDYKRLADAYVGFFETPAEGLQTA
jgi:hypothetical protein